MNNLKKLRESKNMRQIDLANCLGFKRNTVAKWETGKNSIPEKKLIMLADYFDVSCDEVLNRDTPNTA